MPPLLKKLVFIWSMLVFVRRKRDLRDFEVERLGSAALLLFLGANDGGGLVTNDRAFPASAEATMNGFPVAVFDRKRLGAAPSPP